MPPTTVYVLTNPSFAPVKIGFSQNVNQRLGVLNAGVPERFHVYHSCEVPTTEHARHFERRLHRRFASHRAPNGEFFNVDPDEVALEMSHMFRSYRT